MLTTSSNWDSLWELDGTLCTYKIVIGTDTYTGLDDIEGDTLKIQKSLFTAGKLIGNTPCFSMECCLRLGGREIPRGAMMTAYVALKNGGTVSDYLPLGTFKVYRRQKYQDDWVKLVCRDRMQMANQVYYLNHGATGEWPRSMKTVLEESTQRVGIEIDPRTVINTGDDWMVPFPNSDSIRQVWSYIAAAHGGNFLVTPEDKLLLVTPKATESAVVDTLCSAGGFESLGEAVCVDQVTLVVDSDISFSSGESGANNIRIDCPYANQGIVDHVKSILTGVLYQPVKASEVVFNPAAEIQDSYRVNGFLTTWGSLDLSCEIVPVFQGESENPAEPDSEYEFEDTPTNKLVQTAKQYADWAVAKQTQEDIFNKLTKNGQCEGLFLSQDGNLYINATYINSGILTANLITAGILQSKDGETFVLDLDKGTLKMKGSGTVESADGNSYVIVDGNEFILHSRSGEYGQFLDIARIGFTEDSEGYDYPYFIMGHADEDGSNFAEIGLIKMFKNGLYVGNSAPRSSTGSFLGLAGSSGFFIDTIHSLAYVVSGTNMKELYTGTVDATFA